MDTEMVEGSMGELVAYCRRLERTLAEVEQRVGWMEKQVDRLEQACGQVADRLHDKFRYDGGW
jgi:hypothetical protein